MLETPPQTRREMKRTPSSATSRRCRHSIALSNTTSCTRVKSESIHALNLQVVQKTQQHLEACPDSLLPSLSKDILTKVDKLVGQVLNIREVLGRQQVKVVFIGRTSSGKSTLINALLGEKVLPTGLGHTTSCFVQVKGKENARTTNQVK